MSEPQPRFGTTRGTETPPEQENGEPLFGTPKRQRDANAFSELFKVGVKVPPFWPDRPALWFAQLEGQFILSGITADTTKFYYATSHLDHQYAIEVADIIEKPPNENKYQLLKTELIRRLSRPREEEVKQFLNNQEMGNRKPSQFMRHLQHLAGPQVPEEFIRTAWYNRLPLNIQPIIASHTDMPIEKLAELADKVIAVAAPSLQVFEATPSTSQCPNPNQYIAAMEGMARQITELTKQVAALTTRQNRTYNRRFDRSRSKSRSKTRYNQNSGVCYYHRKFGANANKCLTPCQYKQENFNGSH